MKILIAGGTGSIGMSLANRLKGHGHTVHILTRSKSTREERGITYHIWNPEYNNFPAAALDDTEVIVVLNGAGIADKRWTALRKKELIDSRVQPLNCIMNTLATRKHIVRQVISASGIGYYGNTGDKWVGEDELPENIEGSDFMVECCLAWEKAANDIQDFCPAVAIVRTGIVLDKKDGAYPQLTQPLRFGIMPLLGGGKAFYSWIHIDDIAGIYEHIIIHTLTGAYNAVAPQPVTLSDLLHTVTTLKHKPYIPVNIPGFALNMLLGEMKAAVLNSNRISAEKIIESGYSFAYPDVPSAVKQLEG